jgi:histone-lysine N-methyltransferase SETMAR
LATHRENAKGLHRSQLNETRTSSPYWPDLAPCDFFLFGDVKGKLIEYRTEAPSELPVRIRFILVQIPRETLNAVFLEWMERLRTFVQVDGESGRMS